METILVGVLVPIIVGPLSIYLKSLYDRYNEKKDIIMRNRYEAKIKILDRKINSFYWPVYLKLKCLYRLNYRYHKTTLPHNNMNRIINQNYNGNGNKNENGNENENKDNKINTNLKLKLSDTSDDNYNLNELLTKQTIIKKKIKRKRRKKNLKWEHFEKEEKKIESPSTTDIDFLNDDSSMSSDSDETRHKKILVEVEDSFLTEIDKKVINLSKEIKHLIEKNISIIQPNENLINEIIKFVRFTEMEIIVFNVNNNNFNRKYNYQDMGVVNNTKSLYKIIEKELFESIDEYNNIFQEFNDLGKIEKCFKKRN